MKLPIALRVLPVLALLSACGAEDGQDPYAQAGQLPGHHFNQAKRLRELTGDPHSISDKLFILWEYAGALRERDLAKIVLSRSSDPEIRSLAVTVRDGHQAGIDTMVPIARELGMTLPEGPTETELVAIEAARTLPAPELEQFFLLRQRAMHAWDITMFEDYGAFARNERLRRYIAQVRKPLRDHAEKIVRLSNRRGIKGQLSAVQGEEGRN